MLCAGNLLFITPYVFKNGNTPAPKFFIVLANDNNGLVLASLPTSKDYIPGHLTKKHGCIDSPKDNFNCYYFPEDREVCDNGFKFKIETFVYGALADIIDEKLFNTQYPQYKGVTLKGKLKKEEYAALIRCLKSSPSVTRKVKRLL